MNKQITITTKNVYKVSMSIEFKQTYEKYPYGYQQILTNILTIAKTKT